MTTSEALREALSLSLAEVEQRRVPMLEWARRIPEPKSGTLDFDRFPFQRELYSEAAADKELTVMKATQLGVSAFLIRWALYWVDTKGLTALYIFPTAQHVYEFSDARLTPAIQGSEYLRARVGSTDVFNKSLKKIGLGFLYMRGSESTVGLESIDADIIAFDEFDSLAMDNVPVAERRISGSQVGYIRRVGVPSIPGYGISREYDRSDQRRWMVKCDRCGEWQYVAFNNIDWNKAAKDPPFGSRLLCRRCGKQGIDVLTGEWVAKHPDRYMRGYHMPRMIAAHTDLDKIVGASLAREPFMRKAHFNRDLGEPFEEGEGRLSPKELQAAQRDDIYMQSGYNGRNLVTMGIDVASTRALNVVISEHLPDGIHKKALWIGTVDTFNELVEKMKSYQVNMAAIDHLPEGRLARAFANRFPGRVYLVHYATTATQRVFDINDEMLEVAVKRTEAIDTTIELVRSQRHLLPMDWPESFVMEMCSVVRRVLRDQVSIEGRKEDVPGRVKVEYVKTDPDDTLQACVYDMVATHVWWARQSIEHEGREELTPLDDMLEFERSSLGNESEEGDYSPGPDEGEYGMDSIDGLY